MNSCSHTQNNSYPDKLTPMIILITNSTKEEHQDTGEEEKTPKKKTNTQVANGYRRAET